MEGAILSGLQTRHLFLTAQQAPTSRARIRLWWAGRNVAVRPDDHPLRVDRRRVGLEVTELLLLLGIQPPFTTSLFWRLVKAAVLVGHP